MNTSTEPGGQDILFQLDDADTFIQHAGKWQTVGSVLQERRKTKPEAAILYHECVDQPRPGDPGWFSLKLHSKVYWEAKAVPVTRTEGIVSSKQDHAAGLMTQEMWKACAACEVAWSTRWTTRGLVCVRPAVYLGSPREVPPQRFVVL